MRCNQRSAFLFTVIRHWRKIDRTPLAIRESLGAATRRLGFVPAAARDRWSPRGEARLAPTGPLDQWQVAR